MNIVPLGGASVVVVINPSFMPCGTLRVPPSLTSLGYEDHRESDRFLQPPAGTAAIQSISTKAPNASPLPAKAALAGGASGKYSTYTAFMAA